MHLYNFEEFQEFQESSILSTSQEKKIDLIVKNFISLQKPIDELPVYLQNQLNESGFSRLFGTLSGLALGRVVGKFIAKVLGVNPDGLLYKILTNRLVGAAIGDALASKKK